MPRREPHPQAAAWIKAAGFASKGTFKVARALGRFAGRKVVGSLERHYAAGEVVCWPSLPQLAKLAGVSRATAVRALPKMVAAGLEIRRGRFASTYAIPDVQELKQELTRKLNETPSEPPVELPGELPCELPVEDVSGRSEQDVLKRGNARARGRITCRTCGHNWPDDPRYGTDCNVCARRRSAQAKANTDGQAFVHADYSDVPRDRFGNIRIANRKVGT